MKHVFEIADVQKTKTRDRTLEGSKTPTTLIFGPILAQLSKIMLNMTSHYKVLSLNSAVIK